MYPGVFSAMLSLGKSLVTDLTDEGLVDGLGISFGAAAARGTDLVLDDGSGLAEGVPLTLGLDLGRRHAGDLPQERARARPDS